MSRSIKKGPFIDAKLMKKVEAAMGSNKKVIIKTWSRASVIIPDMVGQDNSSARRSEAHADLRDGEHGRAQARGVRSNPTVQGSHGPHGGRPPEGCRDRKREEQWKSRPESKP